MSEAPVIQSGHLAVSDGHELYYEVCGNPNGIPVLFVHGGPGASFSEADKVFFNFEKYKVAFIDQRGAGQSKPFASLHANTTKHLISDFNVFLDHLGWKKVFLFGGSWGSTLSLAYAIHNPKRITGLMLRGIFLGTKAECDFYLKGGVKLQFPDVWERFISHVPKAQQKAPAPYYQKMMASKKAEVREKYSYEWAYYEVSMVKLAITEEQIQAALQQFSYQSLSPLEAHYILKRCFLPEGFLLKNAKKLAHLPISIVHGRYDAICPTYYAHALHAAFKKKSRLAIVTAGHSSTDEEILKVLISEMKRFETVLSV